MSDDAPNSTERVYGSDDHGDQLSRTAISEMEPNEQMAIKGISDYGDEDKGDDFRDCMPSAPMGQI